ncbi:MAG: hypothetical protein AB3N33_10405 [Puniceicoccaceae bacterium]
MHASFDLYPGYLRHFAGAFDPSKPYRVCYDLHAQRNYKKWRDKNGRQIVEPQVRHEGSLTIERAALSGKSGGSTLSIEHIRAWRTWTDQKPAVQQILKATIDYQTDGYGTLKEWEMTYQSVPILPVKFHKFDELVPFAKSGTNNGDSVSITGAEDTVPAEHSLGNPASSLYTLVDTLQSGRQQEGKVDFLDDLTMFRPGLEIFRLPESRNTIEGQKHKLTGYALVGPAILPQYFWMDEGSRVLAIIGRNVAYTLTEAENI